MDKKKILFILSNLFIFITTAIVVPVNLIVGSRAARLDGSTYPYWGHIVSFTVQSNIFLGIVALIAAIMGIYAYRKKLPLKKGLFTWYLIAASAGMLTCLTVIFFLAPMRAAGGKNYFDMLLETMFFMHFLNPVLAALTLVFLSGDTKIAKKARYLAVLPIIIYAVPYIICVVFAKVWPGFYGVTFGGRDYLIPLVFVVFCLALFGISSALAYFHNKNTSLKA